MSNYRTDEQQRDIEESVVCGKAQRVRTKSKGAGRPTKHPSGKAVTVSIKLSPNLALRLRAVAEELGVTHADVCEMGVDAAEEKYLKGAPF